MMKKSEILFAFFRILSDGVMIFTGLIFVYFVRMSWFETFGLETPVTFFPFELFSVWSYKITLFLVFVLAVSGRYKLGADEKITDELFHLISGLTIGMALILVFFFFTKFTFFSRFIFGGALIASVFLVFSGRIFLRVIRWSFRRRGIGRRKILILGSGKIANKALSHLKDSVDYEIIGILTEKPRPNKHFHGEKILGVFLDLEKIIKECLVEEILLATENPSEKTTKKLVEISHIANIKFRLIPDELGLDLAAVEASTINNLPVLTLLNTPLRGWGRVIKSLLDIFISSVAVMVLLPIFLMISLLIWISDPFASIFYCSERVGRKGKIFSCLKFRTMVSDADRRKKDLIHKNEREGGIFFKLKDDPRITKLGRILRKWSLDELPQLFNVLKGEMSLIGPRPHLPEEVKRYRVKDRRVLSVKPGISGFAQINGRSGLSFEEEMKYELFYLKNWNLWLDGMIFIKSIIVVLQRKNAN